KPRWSRRSRRERFDATRSLPPAPDATRTPHSARWCRRAVRREALPLPEELDDGANGIPGVSGELGFGEDALRSLMGGELVEHLSKIGRGLAFPRLETPRARTSDVQEGAQDEPPGRDACHQAER